jgi:hypothetical protein
VGSTPLRAGQQGSVPIELFASAGLTRLRCALHFTESRLANLSVEPIDAAVASATIGFSNASSVVLDFTASPGQSLQGTQTLARLHFTAPAGQNSDFVPLVIGEIVCTPEDSSKSPSPLLNFGRVTIVGDKPLLEASLAANGDRVLSLYDEPGQTVLIERSTSLGPDANWTTWRSVTLTNLIQRLVESDGGGQSTFYRARR